MAANLNPIWESFVGGSSVELDLLRPEVRDSWRRCREAELDPSIQSAPIVLSKSESEEVCSHSRLYRASREILPAASEYLPNKADSTVILINADCIMLSVQGGIKGVIAAEAAGGVVGSRWMERDTGTDALSLCIRLKSPAFVSDFEHYCKVGHGWTGAAVPIFSPHNHSLIGALAVYNYGLNNPERMLRLCSRFVSFIERELRNEAVQRRLLTLEMQERIRSSYPNDKIVSVSEYGEILSCGNEWIVPLKCFEQMKEGAELHLSAGRGPIELKGRLRDRLGQPFEARFFPAMHEGEVAGFVAVLPSPRKHAAIGPLQSWKAVHHFDNMVGSSPAMQKCMNDARRYASVDLPVLIKGESGTGKELFAQAIHNESKRSNHPFVAINCGASRDELLASDLFGYSEGSFTGAMRGGRSGKLETAEGGTIFLDEIESMSPYMQASLLRVLEEGFYSKIGGTDRIPFDVRFLAATNADLNTKSGNISFRSDLYFRLASLTLTLPPLRERRADIPELIEYHSPALSKTMSPATISRLQDFCWPGNIRQLKNVLQRAEVRGLIDTDVLETLKEELCMDRCIQKACSFRDERPLTTYSAECDPVDNDEKRRIINVLQQCNWSVTAAANKLGLHRVTLSKKLARMDIRRFYS
jgi:sigma-54 dependent transcriptional regulator, acetoin dehydrogenase operon transcriptional activator AcoR